MSTTGFTKHFQPLVREEQMPSSLDRVILRTEALPVETTRLDTDQQHALKLLLRCLEEAVAEVQETVATGTSSTGTSAVHQNRHSRTFFVAGERGSGKTTLLLTARAMTDRFQSSVSTTSVTGSALPLQYLRDNLVWLETLDLEPFPSDGNIFSAVLARIEDVVVPPSLGGTAQEERYSLVEPAGSVHDALLNLQRLATEVAVGWDGNLSARQGHLDPNNYAAEVHRAERSRLGVGRKLGDALDQLAVTGSRDMRTSVFVLPVDDADLNPVACRDFLRLLRTLLSPRLFVVVLGDLELFRDTISLNIASGFAQVASPMPYSYVRTPPLTGYDPVHELLRKYFPEAQRAQLRQLTVEETWGFKPLDAKESVPALGDLICREEPKLRDVFVADRLIISPLWEADVGQLVRSTGHLVTLRPRSAADLWNRLSEDPRTVLAETLTTWVDQSDVSVPEVVSSTGTGPIKTFKGQSEQALAQMVARRSVIDPSTGKALARSEIQSLGLGVASGGGTFQPSYEMTSVLSTEPTVPSIDPTGTPSLKSFTWPAVTVATTADLDRVTDAWNRSFETATTVKDLAEAWVKLALWGAETSLRSATDKPRLRLIDQAEIMAVVRRLVESTTPVAKNALQAVRGAVADNSTHFPDEFREIMVWLFPVWAEQGPTGTTP
jgi:hypothetical protein